MSFRSRARASAAEEYGRLHAEKYAARARAVFMLKVMAIVVFACWMYYLANT